MKCFELFDFLSDPYLFSYLIPIHSLVWSLSVQLQYKACSFVVVAVQG